MIDVNDVKSLIIKAGADLCGIAGVDRFHLAPKGFRPNDIWSDALSVAVYAVSMPGNTHQAKNIIPYTFLNGLMAQHLDQLTLRISRLLDDLGISNVAIPSDDPYESWNEKEQRGMAILSMRHAGYLAGLGVMGRSGLLINNRLGNMIQLGAVLLGESFPSDPMAEYQVCPDGCTVCIDNCPTGALGGESTSQKSCRPLSVSRNSRGFTVKKCWLCRSICPSSKGISR